MSLYKIVRSKLYKNFMAKLYGIGASIVITGALFKILHWQWADQMLMVGMFTEAIIFFCSAFEPLHKEYDWALVYPELQLTESSGKEQPKTVSQQLDKMLADAKIGPELIESLAAGMKNLSDNARKLSNITDAAAATDGYVSNLSKAKDAVQQLAGIFEKSADAIVTTSDMQIKNVQEIIAKQREHADKLQSSLAETTEMHVANAKEIYDVQKQHAQNLQNALTSTAEMQVKSVQEMFEMQKIHAQKLQEVQSQTVQSIGQIQEKGTQTIMENYRKIQDSSATLANSMNDTVQESQKYKQEIDKLSKQVAQINAIYANMLAAMTSK